MINLTCELTLAGALLLLHGLHVAAADTSFPREEIDAQPPRNPWVKIVGDINGDKRPDVIIGGQNGPLVWYANPTWTKSVIAAGGYNTVEGEAGDLDGDGDMDVILGGTFWYENPRPDGDPAKDPWPAHRIATLRAHDVEVADLNDDGKLDIIVRDQSGFGHNAGNRAVLFYQVSPTNWTRREISCPHGEGLKVTDLDGDGKPDVIIGGRWYENPGRDNTDAIWKEHIFAPRWERQDSRVVVADFNGDKRPDVALSAAEPQGESYRIAWYEAPRDRRSAGDWSEHVVDGSVETVVHALNAADLDQDGISDLVAASMHQGKSPQEVRVYFSKRSGQEWQKQVISTRGSHETITVDLDGDGAIDIVGANHGGPYQPVEWWRNTTPSASRAKP